MIDILITETCREMGRGHQWHRFKEPTTLYVEDITEAHQVLKDYLRHIYNTKRRVKIYQDTNSKGTLHIGYIYSGIEDTNYLQAWCSFYDHKTRLPINPRNGAKYYQEENLK